MVYVRAISDAARTPDPLAQAKPDYGELVVGGGTAFQSASTAAETVKGTGVAAGNSSGATLSATDGTITIVKPGVYRVGFACHDYITGNSGVVIAKLLKNGSAFTKRIQAKSTAAGTAVQQSGLSASRREVLAKGDVLTLTVETSVGTVTLTEAEIWAEQITDTGTN